MAHPDGEKVSAEIGSADLAEYPLELPSRAAHLLGHVDQAQVKLSVTVANHSLGVGEEGLASPFGLGPRHP